MKNALLISLLALAVMASAVDYSAAATDSQQEAVSLYPVPAYGSVQDRIYGFSHGIRLFVASLPFIGSADKTAVEYANFQSYKVQQAVNAEYDGDEAAAVSIRNELAVVEPKLNNAVAVASTDAVLYVKEVKDALKADLTFDKKPLIRACLSTSSTPAPVTASVKCPKKKPFVSTSNVPYPTPQTGGVKVEQAVDYYTEMLG